MSCLSMSMPFLGLFCLWEAWRRRSSCWRESEPMISSDATFLSISASRAGKISWRLPGWWVCSIFVKACWRRTTGGNETGCYQTKEVAALSKCHKYFTKQATGCLKPLASAVVLPVSLRNTHIEAIMGHIWWNCNIIMTHSLVHVFVMFDQDSLWPHVLFSPSLRRETAEQN